jgi:Fe2+ or Zn2+ uptake regulation protein
MRQDASDRASRLRAAGLKVTGPRLAILAELEQNAHHPSAEELHRTLLAKHPSLSLSTVYMTLEAFVRAGLVCRLTEVDGRMRVDGFDQPHDHAICRGCRRIFDLPRGAGRPPAPPSALPEGLRVLAVRVEYDVLCGPCSHAGCTRA